MISEVLYHTYSITAKENEVGILGDNELRYSRLVEVRQLCVGLVRSHDAVDSFLTTRLHITTHTSRDQCHRSAWEWRWWVSRGFCGNADKCCRNATRCSCASPTGMKFIYPETAWEILPTIKIGVGAQAAKY